MHVLTAVNHSLSIVLTGAVTTQLSVTVTYSKKLNGALTKHSKISESDDTTPVVISPTVGTNEEITIHFITVQNPNSSDVTFQITQTDGTNTAIPYQKTLSAGESWNPLKGRDGENGATGETGSVSSAGALILNEASAPSTATDQAAIWVPTSDNLLRFRGESNGTERRIALVDTDSLADKDLFYYDSASGSLKRIAIGTAGQSLIAQPSSNPPYQWATPREVLTADRTYYVRTDGSDSNTGLTDTAGGAFLTIEKARNALRNLDGNGFIGTVSIGAGTFSLSNSLSWSGFVGFPEIKIQGQGSSTIITSSVANVALFKVESGQLVTIEAVKLTHTATTGSNYGIQVISGGFANIKNIDFGSFSGTGSVSHVRAEVFGLTYFLNSYTISGGAKTHIFSPGGWIEHLNSGITITISGTPGFTDSFAKVNSGGIIRCSNSNVTFSGSATGKRYDSGTHGLINTFGSGATFFPGNASGTVDATTYGVYA